MENQRTLLYITLFFFIFLLWQAWQQDYGPQPVVDAAGTSAQQTEGQAERAADVPEAAMPAEMAATPTDAERRIVHVITDVLDLEIDTRGGDVRRLDLRKYPQSPEAKDQPYRLLAQQSDYTHIAQSGIISSQSSAPDNASQHDVYEVAQTQYKLAEGDDELNVVMHWQKDGVKVEKIFTFKRDSYVIDVTHRVYAQDQPWFGQQYRQLKRTETDSSTSTKSAFIHTYTGGILYNESVKYKKISFSDMADKDYLREQELNKPMEDGWIAMIQHYFLAAWVPDQSDTSKPYTIYLPNTGEYILGITSPVVNIAAGASGEFHSRLVAGPKLHDRLEQIAPGLELTVDYGVLTILSKPLFWLLKTYHGWFDNWGWAIIFLTLTVKLVFYKLSETSYRSMAKMRKLGPRLQSLKERYGDDRQRMSQAMMQMYKEEKINPLGGCLPILVQIPVFIALYWVLLESVEMRNAPFALWITNLSEKDPYYVLPIIMGVSMFVQQKLNPAPMDPMQQKLFQIMPVMFTVFFLWFPAGLVLYWVVNNLLSIAQQWVITRRIEAS
jgi:YidC/Oxa1 family membrane protein insertase